MGSFDMQAISRISNNKIDSLRILDDDNNNKDDDDGDDDGSDRS